MDEECHIEGKMEFEAAIAECCDARTAIAVGLVFLLINACLDPVSVCLVVC